jgi:aspartate carbamoyltransferase catalytic subunit
MMLRVQRERMSGGFFPTPREYTVGYGLTRPRWSRCRRATRRRDLHPGPMNRGLEISADAAESPKLGDPRPGLRGVAVRMAVLYHLLAGEEVAA